MALVQRTFDVIVIGAGGAGMRCALQLTQAGKKVALVSKVFPTRSHTVAAQGGITAALGNMDEDNWHWHMFDTVKGSDYLGDQDAIEYMCRVGPEIVYELEHMGLPFSRTKAGKIYQRPFGGQSKGFGKQGQATRTSAAADRTGHALLHTLYQQNLALDTSFYNEWFAIDLIKADNHTITGVVAMCIETGELLYLHAKAVVLATGGAGQIYESTTNAHINTGDGIGMALRAGFPVQDMEMWQFHPTGIAGAGALVTEGCRGEGGYLINKDGERFMERYAPNAKDLASRDVVSRSMAIEIREGRAIAGNPAHLLLKLDHLGEDIISTRLPEIRELAKTFANVDPIKDPIPVVPTCHYMMGGIPTNKYGQVISLEPTTNEDKIVKGLYAVGECACVSVHGANRLGGNSLLDLVVFGRAAGLHLIEELAHLDLRAADKDVIEAPFAKVTKLVSNLGTEKVHDLRSQMKAIMQNDFAVFRSGKSMDTAIKQLEDLKQRFSNINISDKSKVFNTELLEALELENLLDVAYTTALGAITRTESRGAHSREDYPERNDKEWIKHMLIFNSKVIQYRAVNMEPETVPAFPPVERTY